VVPEILGVDEGRDRVANMRYQGRGPASWRALEGPQPGSARVGGLLPLWKRRPPLQPDRGPLTPAGRRLQVSTARMSSVSKFVLCASASEICRRARFVWKEESVRLAGRDARVAAADPQKTPSRTLDSHAVRRHHDYRPLRQVIIRKYHRRWQNIMVIA
jgi:hypothetical protein